MYSQLIVLRCCILYPIITFVCLLYDHAKCVSGSVSIHLSMIVYVILCSSTINTLFYTFFDLFLKTIALAIVTLMIVQFGQRVDESTLCLYTHAQ